MEEKKLTPQERYDRNNCTRLSLKFVNSTDADILEQLAKQPNKQGYIKALIRADINKGGQ